jgi:lambda repressor-like predicted transcriptional regulator
LAKQKRRKYAELNTLKGRIREMGMTYRSLSAEIGIGTNTLCDKINGYQGFTIPEAEQISKILDIAPNEIARFFIPRHCETQHKKYVG